MPPGLCRTRNLPHHRNFSLPSRIQSVILHLYHRGGKSQWPYALQLSRRSTPDRQSNCSLCACCPSAANPNSPIFFYFHTFAPIFEGLPHSFLPRANSARGAQTARSVALFRSLSKERKSSLVFSISCALFT